MYPPARVVLPPIRIAAPHGEMPKLILPKVMIPRVPLVQKT